MIRPGGTLLPGRFTFTGPAGRWRYGVDPEAIGRNRREGRDDPCIRIVAPDGTLFRAHEVCILGPSTLRAEAPGLPPHGLFAVWLESEPPFTIISRETSP